MFMTLLVVLLAESPPTTSRPVEAIPGELRGAFEYRVAFKTAHFEYRKFASGHLRDSTPWSRVENNEVNWAGDGVHFIQKGDDDEINYRLEGSMEPAFGVRNACLPTERLIQSSKNLLWIHEGSFSSFGVVDIGNWIDYVDIRTVGLHSTEFQRRGPIQFLENLQQEKEFSYKVVDTGKGMRTIIGKTTADRRTGERIECEWAIDIEKGPSILSARTYVLHRDGHREMVAESRSQIVNIDGKWWPMSVDYEGQGLEIHYTFKRIEFDREEHPRTIDTEYFGIPIGATIQNGSAGTHSLKPEKYIGNGQSVDLETWVQIKANFELSAHRDFVLRMRSLGSGTLPSWWSTSAEDFGLVEIAHRPDEWTAYVRRWVTRHTSAGQWRVVAPLTEEQKASADAILKDCLRKAAPIRLRIAKENSRINAELRRLTEVNTTTKPVGDQRTNEQVAQLNNQKIELDKQTELTLLFDELKTRLEGLLTIQQRTPSNGQLETGGPASRPATTARPRVAGAKKQQSK